MFPSYTLKQLAYFVAAADRGTTLAAAEETFISQSAMSQALTDLERAVGVQLFVRRKGKGLSLTESGKNLLPGARRILADAGEWGSAATNLQRELSGRLVVGCFEIIAPSVMPRLIRGFSKMYPSIEIDFFEGSRAELRAALLEGRIEVGILLEASGSGFITEVLFNPTPHALLPSTHALASAESVSLRELSDEPLIFMDADPSHEFIARAFEAAETSPKIRFRSKSLDHVRSLVRAGLGYSVIVQQVRPHRSRMAQSVASVPLSDPISADPIVLVRSEGVRLTRRAEAFWDFCLQAEQ